MRTSTTLFLFILLFLLASCGGGHRVMDTGLIQKRKHLSGWDLALRSKETGRSIAKAHAPAGNDSSVGIDPIKGTVDAIDIIDEELSTAETNIELAAAKSFAPSELSIEQDPPSLLLSPDRSIGSEQMCAPEPQEVERPKKKWNKFAIPAFVAMLSVLYLGLFTTSTIAVVVALAITFILAGISLRQIRSRDEAGKGFALIALILGVLAALVTGIAIYVVGFV